MSEEKLATQIEIGEGLFPDTILRTIVCRNLRARFQAIQLNFSLPEQFARPT